MPEQTTKSSRYTVLRRFDAKAFKVTKTPIDGATPLAELMAQLPDELWVPVDTVEAHDFRDAILQAGGEVEGEYVAVPAARWDANRDEIVVDRRPVVSLRSRSEPAQTVLA